MDAPADLSSKKKHLSYKKSAHQVNGHLTVVVTAYGGVNLPQTSPGFCTCSKQEFLTCLFKIYVVDPIMFACENLLFHLKVHMVGITCQNFSDILFCKSKYNQTLKHVDNF